MRRTSKKKNSPERGSQEWLDQTDLRSVSVAMRKTKFPSIQPTDWDVLYASQQKSRAVSVRLPVEFIARLKQKAIEKGIAYQTLIRLWIGEKLTAG